MCCAELTFTPLCRLFTIAIPLTFFPRVLNLVFGSLLTEMNKPEVLEGAATAAETTIRTLNALERSLAHFVGLTLMAFGTLIVVQVSLLHTLSSLVLSEDGVVEKASMLISFQFLSFAVWCPSSHFFPLGWRRSRTIFRCRTFPTTYYLHHYRLLRYFELAKLPAQHEGFGCS